jgi:hypothetical protein
MIFHTISILPSYDETLEWKRHHSFPPHCLKIKEKHIYYFKTK